MKRIALICLSSVVLVTAGKGPVHKSLRAYSMGNAFVAVAEDKEAVYYNPAGLNLMNRLGNYETHPELGYYPDNYFDARTTIGLFIPLSKARKAYRLGRDLQDLYQSAQDVANASDTSGSFGDVLIDSLSTNSDISDQIVAFDRLPIPIRTKIDFEAAIPHLGGAIWIDGGVSPYIEAGIITPAAGIDTAYLDVVAQGAFAFGIGDKLSLGFGVKSSKREYMPEIEVSLLGWNEAKDTLYVQRDRIQDNSTKFSTIGIAAECGAMYQLQRDVRLGASLRNWYIQPMGDEKITPNITAGVAYSPRRLQRNTGFARKVNLAMDFENMLYHERNYKTLSHLNMGMEIDQVLLAVPNYPNLRALKVRGAFGFKGGYPTAGLAVEVLRIVEFEFSTWAEEAGYYTGAEESRSWVGQVSIGL